MDIDVTHLRKKIPKYIYKMTYLLHSRKWWKIVAAFDLYGAHASS